MAGGSWSLSNAGFDSPEEVVALAVNPQAPATLYAGTLGGARESVFCLREAVGREEGSAAPDAGEESGGLSLDEVEYRVAP